TTDTGWFRFSNTTSEALRACATLVESGADVREVAKHLFEERSYAATKLMGRALGSLEVACEGRLVWANLTREDFGDCQATDEETEGIVNHLKGVRGSEVAVLFREDAQGKVRVSLRSESQVDVSKISHLFGGGGHAAAAGCTLALSLPESQETILGAVRERIEALEGAPGVTSEKR
ncbi:MAG: hypothetical protein HY318_01340, partial [Armatimonadetes bacterium]|nr:hypothetical protein [Armatimonadota bacterium]